MLMRRRVCDVVWKRGARCFACCLALLAKDEELSFATPCPVFAILLVVSAFWGTWQWIAMLVTAGDGVPRRICRLPRVAVYISSYLRAGADLWRLLGLRGDPAQVHRVTIPSRFNA